MTTTVTARQRWTDAVWESGDLTPLEKLTALCFASFAGKTWPRSWVAGAALRGRTGLSRDASNRAIRGLEDKGWLTPIGKAGRAHRSVLYLLDVPARFRLAESERSGRRNRDVPGDGTEPLREPRQEPRPEKDPPSIAAQSTQSDELYPNQQNLRRLRDQGHDQADYDAVAWAARYAAEHGSTNWNQLLGTLMKTIEGDGVGRAEELFGEEVMRVVQDGSNRGAVVHAPNHP